MAYNSIEKKRLEEYKKILSMAEKKESSINMPLPTNVPGGTNYLPTRSGQMAKQVKTAQQNNSNKVGATLRNLGLLLGKGAVNTGERALDFLNNMTAKTTSKAFELIGRDDLAQKETESRRNFIKRDLTQELGTATGASQQITKNEQNGSLLTRDNLSGQIVQAVGGQLPTIAISALTGVGGLNSALNGSNIGTLGKIGTTALINAPTNAMLASSSYGGALQEAYLDGATEEEATKYAIGSTAVEIASEWVTGGIPGTGGKGGIDILADKGIDKISNKLVQDLVRYGYKMVGEGVEEGIAEIMSPILKNATYSSGEKINWNDVINSAIVGGISAGIIEVPSTVSNVANDIKQNKNTKLPTVNDIVNQEKNNNIDSNKKNEYIIDNNNRNENIIEKQDKIIKYTNHEIENFSNGKVKVATTYQDVSTFVESAKKVPSNAKLYFGKIGIVVASKIKSQLGINVENYNISLKANSIKHILTHHSGNKELLRGQIPITENDFNLIPEIISNYDSVEKSGTTQQGKPTLTFKKQIGDVYYLVNYVSDKNHNLEVQTMYKQKKKNSATASNAKLPRLTPETNSSTSSLYANNIPQNDNNVKSGILPINNNMQNNDNNTINMPVAENKKVMNPLEISKMSKEDTNTTPILPTIKVSTGDGESKFASNIRNKTNMLTEESKNTILSDEDVRYYKEVTNKESLEKAYKRLNDGGENEVFRWFDNEENIDDVDIAEGYILLKQYQDKIINTTDLTQKDYYNRSMVQVAKKMRKIGTKAGQTVQAFNILNRLTPEGMVYYAQSELSEAFDNMSKNKTKEWIDSNRDKFELTPEETQFIMDTMQEVQQMEDGYDKRVKLAEIQKVMTDKLPPSKGAEIKAWMRISMLFNPKTQVRNVAGNAIIAPVNSFSDLFASAIDKQISKKTGVRTTGTTDLKNYAKGFKKGVFESYNDFKKGINTRNIQGNRFEITEGRSFNDNTSIGKALNRVDSFLSFLLDAGDRTFYEATFTNSINNQLILNNTDVVTQEMIDIAKSEALSRTWQDNNNYTKFVLSVRNMLNNVNVKGYGLGDVLIPFAKTPANLTKAIIDYSPAGLIKTIVDGNNLRKSLTNGQYTAQMQHQFVQDLGKATAGTMLYVLGYALAKVGVVSGESDDDKDVANFMKNTLGISSYSIKIGNKSFTYDWAQPIAAPLSIMANVVNSENKETALLEGVVSSLDSAGSILLEQSFLQSINDVLNSNDGIVSGIINEVLELPSRAVPTLMKQIADLVDPVQRTSFEYGKPIESAVNSIKAKIPFVSKTLSPSVDTMGREIQKYGGKNNIFNVFFNPANVNTENISKSAEEIYRLYKETGETNIMPRVAPYYVNQGEKIILNSKQRAEYQKISGEIIENSVKELLNNSKYKNMNDIEKTEIINKIVNYSYNKAREKILNISMSNEYNKVNLYITDGGSVSNYYLNKEEIDYSYNYPEKYKTITQITTYDKYLIYQDEIDTVKDKYENTNQRKSAVISYVNSLDLSIPQKAMLIKMNYSSFDSYNKQIIEYINNQDLTKTEKTEILTKLGFTIKDGKVYY